MSNFILRRSILQKQLNFVKWDPILFYFPSTIQVHARAFSISRGVQQQDLPSPTIFDKIPSEILKTPSLEHIQTVADMKTVGLCSDYSMTGFFEQMLGIAHYSLDLPW